MGDGLFRSGAWWVLLWWRTRLVASPRSPGQWGAAVRVPRHSSATHPGVVVCMERYGHSTSWAQSHGATRTAGGVMPIMRARSWAVPEPHAAFSVVGVRQRIS